MKISALSVAGIALSLLSHHAQASGPFGNPSEAKITIYGVAISKNADCSNAVMVDYNPAGKEFDFKASPALLSAPVAAGTYNCVILSMKSLLTFKPQSTVGNCTAGTEYVRNIANGSVNYTPFTLNSDNTLTYGTSTPVTGSNSQDITHANNVLLFLSTGTSGTGQTGEAFIQPTDAPSSTKGIHLGAPFVVSSKGGSGTFVVNFDGALDGGQTPCDLGPPTFSFR